MWLHLARARRCRRHRLEAEAARTQPPPPLSASRACSHGGPRELVLQGRTGRGEGSGRHHAVHAPAAGGGSRCPPQRTGEGNGAFSSTPLDRLATAPMRTRPPASVTSQAAYRGAERVPAILIGSTCDGRRGSEHMRRVGRSVGRSWCRPNVWDRPAAPIVGASTCGRLEDAAVRRPFRNPLLRARGS